MQAQLMAVIEGKDIKGQLSVIQLYRVAHCISVSYAGYCFNERGRTVVVDKL